MNIIKANIVILFNAFAAMIVYGGWAVYANFEHGQHAYVMAGLVQGMYAFISTLTMTSAARWMYEKFGRGHQGILSGFSFGFMVMLAIPVIVHNIAGTPDILETILPGLIWGTGYLLTYLILAEKRVRKKRM